MRQLKITSQTRPKRSKSRAQTTRWGVAFYRRFVRALKVSLVVLAMGWVLWLFWQSPLATLTDRLHTKLVTWTTQCGLRVQTVHIEGRSLTSKEELKKALGPILRAPMLSLSPETMQAALEDLPWVAAAVVRRSWPTTVHVRLLERQPAAIWRRGKKRLLVDRAGVVLTEDIPSHLRHLMVIGGEKAPTQIAQLEALLQQVPSIQKRVVLATFIGGRRWDLRLNNEIEVQLPEEGADGALQELSRLLETFPLQSADVRRIDLRLPDKLIMSLTPAGQAKLRGQNEGKST